MTDFLLLAEQASTLTHVMLGGVMLLIAVFLILLVLVQRGRGGGLTGALGGMGGQSAFGTKAGDIFTRITMTTAAVWILVCMFSLKMLHDPEILPANSGLPPAAGPADKAEDDTDAGFSPLAPADGKAEKEGL